jgi:hypothetical protein
MKIMGVLLVLFFLFLCTNITAQQARPDEPRYTNDGQLVRPDNYREWIYLSSGLGMTYGLVEKIVNTFVEHFDNVFVTQQAYKSFLSNGRWPDKTMFVMEVRSSATKGSINKGGHYQEDLVGIEVHLKDESRFPAKWAFFVFKPSAATAKPLPANSACQSCHFTNGAVDETFVQFYPTLIPIAKAKGTFKQPVEK